MLTVLLFSEKFICKNYFYNFINILLHWNFNERTKMKLTSRVIILMVLFIGAASYAAKNASADRYELSFKVFESEFSPGKYIQLNDIPSGKLKKTDIFNMPLNKNRSDRMLTLIAEFNSSKIKEPYLLIPPIEYAANVYLNGALILKMGSTSGNYNHRLHYTKALLLPPVLLRNDSDNILAVQLYPLKGEKRRPFSSIFVMEREAASWHEFMRNLTGPGFSFALLVFSFCVFVYFMSLYLSQNEVRNKYYLYFALLNLAGMFMNFNNAVTFDFQNMLLVEKIAKSANSFATAFTVLFILEYTRVIVNRKKLIQIILILFSAGALLIVLQNSYDKIAVYYFPQILFFHFPFYIFVLYLLFRYMSEKRNSIAISLFAIYLISFFFIVHDSYYLITIEAKPYILLIPYAMFIVNLTVFLILANEQRQLLIKSIENEKAFENLNRNLERIVKERTLSLNDTVERLNGEIEYRKKIQEELDNANSTKDKLFSVIGHDLRNIFSTMINYSEFIVANVKEGDYSMLLQDSEQILGSSKRAYAFLENLVEWSASQMKGFNPVKEKINLSVLVADTFELIRLQGQEKKVSLRSEINGETYVYADKRMLQSILKNLISNGIKYSSDGAAVTLSAQVSANTVNIAITDQGIGIENITELLEWRIQKSRKGTYSEKGSGLGLLIVKDFLDFHLSNLIIESTPGKGSKFSFEIQKG